jgi:hypothetical protein
MNRFRLLVCCCAVIFALHGCGPMRMPMAARPDEEGQKALDQSWNKALTPVGRLDRQAILDVLVGTQAYQFGVDRLTFRSEKKVAAGLVVMEIAYDRLKPGEDRFEVKVYDAAGKLLRQESFGRKEVEETYNDLFVNFEMSSRKAEGGQAPPEPNPARQRFEARWKAIQELFPNAQEGNREGKEKKP